MVCDRRGKVEKDIRENMTVGVGRRLLNTSVCLKSQREKRTVPGTDLSIPFICYLLLHPAQHASPRPSSLLPLRCVPSPRAVIKTTGGIRNAAWLLPACNRHHLDHKRGGGSSPPPLPSPPSRVKHQRRRSLIGPWCAPEQKAI